MSAKITTPKSGPPVELSKVVADNIRTWRSKRGLDQAGLAARLGELGWTTDRPTVNRIEKRKRKLTVDELGRIAVALSVPLTLLLLPVFSDERVALTPGGPTMAVHGWALWEWMNGEQPIGGPSWMPEWRSGADPLWRYERLRAAQLVLDRLDSAGGQDLRPALQELVDAESEMTALGMSTVGLISPKWADQIKRFRIEATAPKPVPRTPRNREA